MTIDVIRVGIQCNIIMTIFNDRVRGAYKIAAAIGRRLANNLSGVAAGAREGERSATNSSPPYATVCLIHRFAAVVLLVRRVVIVVRCRRTRVRELLFRRPTGTYARALFYSCFYRGFFCICYGFNCFL